MGVMKEKKVYFTRIVRYKGKDGEKEMKGVRIDFHENKIVFFPISKGNDVVLSIAFEVPNEDLKKFIGSIRSEMPIEKYKRTGAY